MTIQEWGAIGEVIGGVAVVLTLAYLAVQIRQNTRVVKVTGYQALISQLQQAGFVSVQDAEASDLMVKAYRQYGELSPEQRAQAAGFIQATFMTFQSHHYMYRQGLLDEDLWVAHRENLRRVVCRRGARAWWDSGVVAFSEPFTRLVSDLIAESAEVAAHQDEMRSSAS